jgi:hypothetical protein
MAAFEYRQAETSKEATGRAKDRESLPRLRAFRMYWQSHAK